jgi:formylglycine-generating enzyme required for sulfatase activity
LARTADLKTKVTSTVVPAPNPTVATSATGNLLVAPFTEAKAKEVQKSVAKSLQKEVEEKVDLGKSTKLDMVLIPAGKFKMGDLGKDHDVTLTRHFYMGKYEVTQEQWQSLMGNNPSIIKGEKLPVTNVSWDSCQEFIKNLNVNTKGNYRLPTEAEWEYACRAGTSTPYSFGEIITPKDANYGDSEIGEPLAVGGYKPNSFGLYNMHGNVWEWCNDWQAAYSGGAVTDPKGPAQGEYRVLRGGSFGNSDSSVRSSNRSNYNPSERNYYSGFRLVRTP